MLKHNFEWLDLFCFSFAVLITFEKFTFIVNSYAIPSLFDGHLPSLLLKMLWASPPSQLTDEDAGNTRADKKNDPHFPKGCKSARNVYYSIDTVGIKLFPSLNTKKFMNIYWVPGADSEGSSSPQYFSLTSDWDSIFYLANFFLLRLKCKTIVLEIGL